MAIISFLRSLTGSLISFFSGDIVEKYTVIGLPAFRLSQGPSTGKKPEKVFPPESNE
jgi:hypothetical protein